MSDVRRDSDGRDVPVGETTRSDRVRHGTVLVGVVRSSSVSSASRRLTIVVVSDCTPAAVVADCATLTHESLDCDSAPAAVTGAENHGRAAISAVGLDDGRHVAARWILHAAAPAQQSRLDYGNPRNNSTSL